MIEEGSQANKSTITNPTPPKDAAEITNDKPKISDTSSLNENTNKSMTDKIPSSPDSKKPNSTALPEKSVSKSIKNHNSNLIHVEKISTSEEALKNNNNTVNGPSHETKVLESSSVTQKETTASKPALQEIEKSDTPKSTLTNTQPVGSVDTSAQKNASLIGDTQRTEPKSIDKPNSYLAKETSELKKSLPLDQPVNETKNLSKPINGKGLSSSLPQTKIPQASANSDQTNGKANSTVKGTEKSLTPRHLVLSGNRRFPRWTEMHSASKTRTEREPQSEVMYRSLVALLGSRKINATNEVCEYITDLAEEYLQSLISELRKAALIQRRTSPGISDVMIMFHLAGIHLGMLEEEVEDQKNNPTILHDLWQYIDFEALQDTTSTIDSAFIETKETNIKTLLPGAYSLGAHIPSWMPEFPPEHTFRATPYHPNRVTNPRILREMIVKEGQLAEQALRRLTGVVKVDDNAEMVEDQDEVEEKEEDLWNSKEALIVEDLDTKMSDSNNNEDIDKLKKVDDKEATNESKLKPTLSLKLTLGATTASEPSPVTAKTNKDPFNLSVGLKRPFDIREYMKKQAHQQTKRRQRQEKQARREQHRERVLDWHRALIESNPSTYTHKTKAELSNKEESMLKFLKLEPEEEDLTASGFGPAPGIVEKEYNAALLWISKTKKDGQQKSDIADTGIVNCERNKYIY